MRRHAAWLLVLCISCSDDDATVDDTEDGSTSADTAETTTGGATTSSTTDATTSSTTESTTSTTSTSAGSTGGSLGCQLAVDCPTSPGYMPVETLVQLLGGDTPRIIDVRGINAFEMEHIPGAVQLDPSAVRATVDGVSGQVAPEVDVRALWESIGLVESDAVVVYGADNGTDPARVVWTLAYYGHTGSVWALDGGFQAWTGDTETGPASPAPSTYQTTVVSDLRVDEAQVLASLNDNSFTLFDARTSAEYDTGHIPGAIHVDWTTNIGPGGLLLGPAELNALYGPPDPTEVLVTYCQTGSRASVDWLVLASLGYEDVRIYDGSWAEWSADMNNPVE